MPASAASTDVNQLQIERVRDGRIVEHWRVTDELELMRQLGLSGVLTGGPKAHGTSSPS